MTVNSDQNGFLSDSTVSSSSGESDPFMFKHLLHSGIPKNTIFTETAVNSSQQCILPRFTVPPNHFGEY